MFALPSRQGARGGGTGCNSHGTIVRQEDEILCSARQGFPTRRLRRIGCGHS